MNYIYIEQLLERYWKGETTLDEEQILRSFFSQDNVPEHLMEYSDFFACTRECSHEHVSDDFDLRFADIIESEERERGQNVRMRAIRIPSRRRFIPLLKAAAAVALTLTVGEAALHGLMQTDRLQEAELTSGTYVQADEVHQVIETVQRSMTAKADSISSDIQIPVNDVKTE